MEYVIQITDDPMIIRVAVTGNWRSETDQTMALEIMAKVDESKVDRVLIDMRELEFTLPIIDIFQRAKDLSEQRRGFRSRSTKVALVYQPQTKQVEETFVFFENTSQNRGLPYRVFKRIEFALEWLAE